MLLSGALLDPHVPVVTMIASKISKNIVGALDSFVELHGGPLADTTRGQRRHPKSLPR
jgi:hypothetical protein